MVPVIYGKHPAFGDFLAHGLPHENLAPLDAWLERVLPDLKSAFADSWEAAWGAAPPLKFWLGPSILEMPLSGLFMTSMDRVGRRYPLIFGLAGKLTAPPTNAAHDAQVYDLLWDHVTRFALPERAPSGATALLQGFRLPDIQAPDWEPASDATIWAENWDVNRVLTDARPVDAQYAQFHRSHWWKEAREHKPAAWLSCDGLPDGAALGWLLAPELSSPAQAMEG